VLSRTMVSRVADGALTSCEDCLLHGVPNVVKQSDLRVRSQNECQRGDDLLDEEASSHQGIHVQAEELAPRRFKGESDTARGRLEQTFFKEKAADRGTADTEMQLGQFSDDPAVAPVEVFLRQTEDKFADGGMESKTTDRAGRASLALAP
jgi:hypothetical protein